MPEKNRQRLGKKCYNNMFCLRWIVFVCSECFGQWQQLYLVSEGIKRPKLKSCGSKKLPRYQWWGKQPTLNRLESSFLRRRKKVFYNFFLCHSATFNFMSSRAEKCWCSNEFFLDTLIHTEHKYFPPLMLKQMFFGFFFDGVEVAAGEKKHEGKKGKQHPEAKSQNF